MIEEQAPIPADALLTGQPPVLPDVGLPLIATATPVVAVQTVAVAQETVVAPVVADAVVVTKSPGLHAQLHTVVSITSILLPCVPYADVVSLDIFIIL